MTPLSPSFVGLASISLISFIAISRIFSASRKKERVSFVLICGSFEDAVLIFRVIMPKRITRNGGIFNA